MPLNLLLTETLLFLARHSGVDLNKQTSEAANQILADWYCLSSVQVGILSTSLHLTYQNNGKYWNYFIKVPVKQTLL